MSYQDIRDTREGFVRSDIGDRLVRIEAFIVGVVCFIGLLALHKGFGIALITGGVVAFVLPWLMGLIEVFAWIATVLFSLIWAVIGYFIGGAILGDSPIAGAIVAEVIFICSFFAHKVFAGLGYSSVERHVMDSIDQTRDNTANLGQPVSAKYCSSCGTRLNAGANFCNNCGARQKGRLLF